MRRRVKFLRAWDKYNGGDVAGLMPAIAREAEKAGAVMFMDLPPEGDGDGDDDGVLPSVSVDVEAEVTAEVDTVALMGERVEAIAPPVLIDSREDDTDDVTPPAPKTKTRRKRSTKKKG